MKLYLTSMTSSPIKRVKKDFLRAPHFLFFLSICLTLFSGCNETGADDKALVNVLLIDAPGDFDEVWIEVLGVDILPVGSRGLENAEWVHIPYTPANKMVLLSDLVGSQRLLLGRKEIRAGQVSHVRLVLGDEHYLVSGDQQIPLELGSDARDLLTVEVVLNASAGFAFDIYLDFNIATSVKPDNSGGFRLEPQLRAFTIQQTAEIRGIVQPSQARPFVHAIHGEDTLSTLTAGNGEFRLRGLRPNSYRIHIEPRVTHLDSVFTLTVQADSVYNLGNIPLTQSP